MCIFYYFLCEFNFSSDFLPIFIQVVFNVQILFTLFQITLNVDSINAFDQCLGFTSPFPLTKQGSACIQISSLLPIISPTVILCEFISRHYLESATNFTGWNCFATRFLGPHVISFIVLILHLATVNFE